MEGKPNLQHTTTIIHIPESCSKNYHMKKTKILIIFSESTSEIGLQLFQVQYLFFLCFISVSQVSKTIDINPTKENPMHIPRVPPMVPKIPAKS